MDNELNSLAQEVLKNYDIEPDHISVMQGDSIKTVWKVKAKYRLFCLKRLKQSYDKALFSVNAQIHINKSGGNVPSVILDKTGRCVIPHNEQLFVLYEWLPGRDLDLNNAQDLEISLEGLAKFHIASRGYVPVKDARTSSKLGKWPEQYSSMKNRLVEWKNIAKSNAAASHHLAYLNTVGAMVSMADSALRLLDASSYSRLAADGSPSVVLCHQDFGRGNALLCGSGVFVLDLDGVTFDLPARDLRKIIGKLAENKGRWSGESIKAVIDCYSKTNPLSREEKHVLYVDLLFPHWFFGLVKNQYQANKVLKSSEIERIARLELSKTAILEKLLTL